MLYFLKAIEIAKHEPRYVNVQKCAWLCANSVTNVDQWMPFTVCHLILLGTCHCGAKVHPVKHIQRDVFTTGCFSFFNDAMIGYTGSVCCVNYIPGHKGFICKQPC